MKLILLVAVTAIVTWFAATLADGIGEDGDLMVKFSAIGEKPATNAIYIGQ